MDVRERPRSIWKQIDLLLILITLALLGYSMLLVYSATLGPGERWPQVNSWVLRHGLYAVLGFGAMIFLMRVDYRLHRTLAYGYYGVALVLLLLVLVAGHGAEEYGAQRWLSVGPFPFQPSEPAKLALLLALATQLSTREETPPSLRKVLVSLLLLLPAVGLVYLQPDLGTTITMVSIWIGLLFLSGTRARILLSGAVATVAAAPVVWLILHDYMRQRILIYLNPESDPFRLGYNILQARISIGAGGLLGRGLTSGTQTQLHYLRVQHTDFIFSVLAEELGFVGCVCLFLLYIMLVFRLIRAAQRARDAFGYLVACGFASLILAQSLMNIGANLTVLPVAGVPLPFISYGGSALITNLATLGIVQNIVRHEKRR